MEKHKHHKSTLARVKAIKAITEQHQDLELKQQKMILLHLRRLLHTI